MGENSFFILIVILLVTILIATGLTISDKYPSRWVRITRRDIEELEYTINDLNKVTKELVNSL